MTINPLQASFAMESAQSASLKTLSSKAQDEAALHKVARDFEALLIEQMLKEMKKTVKRSDFMGENGPAFDIFDGMLGAEYSKTASVSGGFGLAKMIEDSLKPQAQKRFY